MPFTIWIIIWNLNFGIYSVQMKINGLVVAVAVAVAIIYEQIGPPAIHYESIVDFAIYRTHNSNSKFKFKLFHGCNFTIVIQTEHFVESCPLLIYHGIWNISTVDGQSMNSYYTLYTVNTQQNFVFWLTHFDEYLSLSIK